jgi:hypothetical protein
VGTGSVRGVRRTFMGLPDRSPSVAGNLMIGALEVSIPLAAQTVPNGTSVLHRREPSEVSRCSRPSIRTPLPAGAAEHDEQSGATTSTATNSC